MWHLEIDIVEDGNMKRNDFVVGNGNLYSCVPDTCGVLVHLL